MKMVIILALILLIVAGVWLFAISHAMAAKHEPPSLITKRHITVIYNILYKR